MSFAGHVFDMINRAKQNRAMLTARRERTSKVREAYINAVNVRAKTTFEDKEITPEELAIIKDDIRKKFRKERRLELIVALCATIIGLAAIGYILSRWL
jgi:hypothetical protein